MVLLKNLVIKLIQVRENGHLVRFNHVVFGACCVALVLCLGLDVAPSLVPKDFRRYIHFPEDYKIPEKQLSEAELKQLIFKVEHWNSKAEVFNWDAYRPVDPETTIIVILVHKDVERLQYLIMSLGRVRYISRVLLIFSHSYIHDEINNLVKSINFCGVLQIFYPHSLQLYPNQFPGVDPGDCNSTRAANATPGAPCAERDARRTQYKQHWWWTANYVFEGEWRSDKRIIVFLEEDNYVLPDLLHMLQRTRRVLLFFPAVKVMSFGGPQPGHLEYDLLTIDSWAPPYDMGLAFSLSTWQQISNRSSFYCFYDDCRWSYSLVPVFGNLSSGAADMLACSEPRVLSTSAFASGRRAARWAWSAAIRAPLFPVLVRSRVTVDARGRVPDARRPAGAAGGWRDLRDQMLCLDPLMTANTELETPQ